MNSFERRMATGEPFTFGELYRTVKWNGNGYREADRCIQRWRKKGWISFTRKGRDCVWSLTENGRVETAREGGVA